MLSFKSLPAKLRSVEDNDLNFTKKRNLMKLVS